MTRRAAGLLLLVAGALAAAVTAGARRGPKEGGGSANRDAAVAVEGRLTAGAAEAVRRAAGGPYALLLVLDRRDLLSCEDVGRQLRALQRTTGRDLPLLLASRPEDASDLVVAIRREKVRIAAIVPVSSTRVLENHRPIQAPALLVVLPSGAARGITHPVRSPNVRTLSWAEEIKPLLKEVSAGLTSRRSARSTP